MVINTFANFDSHRLAKNDTQYIVCLKNRARYILMLILKKCQKFHFGEGIVKCHGKVLILIDETKLIGGYKAIVAAIPSRQ